MIMFSKYIATFTEKMGEYRRRALVKVGFLGLGQGTVVLYIEIVRANGCTETCPKPRNFGCMIC